MPGRSSDKEEEAVTETAASRLAAAAVVTEEGELTPRRRSARISRRLSAASPASSPARTTTRCRGAKRAALATEPVITEEEQQQPSKDYSCEEPGTAKDVSTQNDDACGSQNQPPDSAEPVDTTTTTTTQVVQQQQQSPKKLLLEKYQLCEGDQSSTPPSPTDDDAENLQANNKDTAVKEISKPTLVEEDKKKSVKKPSTMIDRRAVHEEAMSLGRRKSGRFWKASRDRFKSVVKSKGVLDAKRRMEMKQEMLRVRQMEAALTEEKKREAEEKRARAEENKRKRAENERKNEVIQQIKNPAKIKRMKKKQLRMLAKRDVVPSNGKT